MSNSNKAGEFVQLETAHHGIINLPIDRSRRRKRTLAIVNKSGQIYLQVPFRMRQKTVDDFVRDQRVWLVKAIQKANQRGRAENKDEISFLGQTYKIQIIRSALLRKKGFCELRGDGFYLYLPEKITADKEPAVIQDTIDAWFRDQAAEIFRSRADHYAAQMNVRYRSIRILDPRSRWGSCDRQGNLMFSWRVLMAPMAIVDYLVVHELAHIVRFDHSPAYWRIVETILPDYKARRKALRAAEHHYTA